MSKGRRREKQAAEIYSDAGYQTYRPPRTKYGDTDLFNLFDVAAVKESSPPVFAQVKANQTRGLTDFKENAKLFAYHPSIAVHYLVCVDRKGWRLALFEKADYEWVVDERTSDCAMGAGVLDYLRGEF